MLKQKNIIQRNTIKSLNNDKTNQVNGRHNQINKLQQQKNTIQKKTILSNNKIQDKNDLRRIKNNSYDFSMAKLSKFLSGVNRRCATSSASLDFNHMNLYDIRYLVKATQL